MASTMETWAKLAGAGATIKGGISGANKAIKKMSPEARMEKKQKKEKRKQDKEIAKRSFES